MSHAHLDELPKAIFENTKKLSELFVNGNNLTKVPESLAAIGDSLEYLHLSQNHIEAIDEASFENLSHLKFLNISSLPCLTEIKEDSFKSLNSLEGLYCHSNEKLASFDMEDLRLLKHLKELDLRLNALTSLDFGEVELNPDAEKLNETEGARDDEDRFEHQFKKLRVLRLAGNPWNCDCFMMKSLSLFNHSAQYFQKTANNDEARCKKPSDLSSKLLYDLPLEYVCATQGRQKPMKIPVYDPPQFLRPKSIMLTVFSVVGVVVLGIIIGFGIVCVKRRLKSNETGYSSSPIRYTHVNRDSTVSNIANSPYSP